MKYFAIPIVILLLGCTSEKSVQADIGTKASMLETIKSAHQVATWKYNAKGAYAIIFDDYCMDGVQGIQDHAAPEAEQRGLVIGFGVVTSFCDAHEWQRAREMIAAGHEVVNHSHTHRCGELRSPWCEDVWSDADVDAEIDQPTNLIQMHTGIRPSFYIFPFDLFTPGKVDHLRQAGYLGARTGQKEKLTLANFTDSFSQLNFDVKFPAESASSQRYGLNEYVDIAIARQQFAFREVHGVQDQSWGTTSLADLRNHFDYLQAKVQSYELWVATISDVIRYNQARRLCQLRSGNDSQGEWIGIMGDAPVCHAGVALSLLFSSWPGLQLKDSKGAPVEPVNGTYGLVTGEIYRLSRQ